MADKELEESIKYQNKIAPDRITIQTSIHHQDLEEHVINTVTGGNHFHLESKEQPFERKLVLDKLLDVKEIISQGWISLEKVGLIIIQNRLPKPKVNVSPEEKKELENNYLKLSVYKENILVTSFKIRNSIPFYFEIEDFTENGEEFILESTSYPIPFTITIFSK